MNTKLADLKLFAGTADSPQTHSTSKHSNVFSKPKNMFLVHIGTSNHFISQESGHVCILHCRMKQSNHSLRFTERN